MFLTFDLQASAVTGLICLAGLSASLVFHLRPQSASPAPPEGPVWGGSG